MIRLSLRAFGRHASVEIDLSCWCRPWAGWGAGSVVVECGPVRGVACWRRQRWEA